MTIYKIEFPLYFLIILILLSVIFIPLSSCTPNANQEIQTSPSPDFDAASTSAVETFQAQLTSTSLAVPTAPPEATITPPPSASTPSPTQTAQTVDIDKYQAEWIDQYPSDRADIVIGEHFDMTWTIRNMGTEVWNENYKLRFVEGWPLGKYATVNLDHLVYPNEDVDILVDMVAPPRPETAVSYWQLINDQGEAFYTVSIRINAILRPTVTKTPK